MAFLDNGILAVSVVTPDTIGEKFELVGEFHRGFHDNWEIRDYKALLHTFPMYTIGEATTATVLTPSDEEWTFDYRSRPEFAASGSKRT